MAQARYGDADLKEFKALIEEKLELPQEKKQKFPKVLL